MGDHGLITSVNGHLREASRFVIASSENDNHWEGIGHFRIDGAHGSGVIQDWGGGQVKRWRGWGGP